MAGSAADAPLGDKTFTLQNGDKIGVRYTFDEPDVDAGRKSVLTYVADPFGDNTVSIECDLNGTNILTHLFNTGEARVLQEIVGKDVLKARQRTQGAGDRHRRQWLDQDRRRRSDVHPERLK